MEEIVRASGIVKSFGSKNRRTTVLDGVDVTIGRGEFVAVMGPSGSGKTTLMFALSGMDAVDQGIVVFDGQDLSAMKERDLADLRRKKMGFVFQQPTLLRNLDLLDNVILPAHRDAGRQTKALEERGRDLMARMGLDGLESRSISEASGGQLQRVGICRALMGEPQIIFGDEPTGALNSKASEEIMDILVDINRSAVTVLLVTHDAKVAARASRVLFMRDGTIADELELPRTAVSCPEARLELLSQKMRDIGI
ncbi:MAG: ABC transporter ATP-binding protein [Actinomycetaceae bacterium]|nr:ABC transporter ATP-binding protein [Actinomycetaceae bacterium]